MENILTQKQRGELFDSFVQNPAVLELIREKKYAKAKQLLSELIDEQIDNNC